MSQIIPPFRDSRVLTEGTGLYVRLKPGTYRIVGRTGKATGGIAGGFYPKPRWRPARRCCYLIAEDGLTCPDCGLYDTHYAMTGERSYCQQQSGRPTRKVSMPETTGAVGVHASGLRACLHDSRRTDGTLDDHCLRCGADGYWHEGHRHDRPHPSGKTLIDLRCGRV